jgi:Tol biopolymer transport system component
MRLRHSLTRHLLLAFIFLVFSFSSYAQISDVSLSPDGGMLAITHVTRKGSFIYLVSTNTGKAIRLTHAAVGWEASPSFSADGKEIAYSFAESRGSHFRIIIQTLMDGKQREWPQTEQDELSPVFALDGLAVAFSTSDVYGSYSPIAKPHAHGWDFFVSDIDGRNIRQITNRRFYFASRPSISPDGKWLAAAVETLDSDRSINLYSISESGRAPKQLRPRGDGIPKRDAIYNSPNFSHDGQTIFFLAARGSFVFDYDVYETNIVTGLTTRLTRGNGYASALSVSAQGKTAAYLKWRSDRRGTPVASKVILLDIKERSTRDLAISGLD